MKLKGINPSEIAMAVIEKYTAIEAGYVNHGDDLGKATKHGITYKTSRDHMELWCLYGWDGDMRTLPIELAYHIYYVSWWRRMKLDHIAKISVELAEIMFDWGINGGRRRAAKYFQMILTTHNKKGKFYPNIKVDGAIGKLTIDAFDAYLLLPYKDVIEKLIFLMHSGRSHRFVEISYERPDEANESFTNGWTDRAFNEMKSHAHEIFGV